ncbi:MAG: hypothetical protein MI723_19675, partial [Caulobacterales bacterium]|nr:hypothetical protein [Caulobacterales bacterium]
GATHPDPLAAHLDRITDAAAHVSVEPWPDRPTAFAAIAAFHARRPGDAPPSALRAGAGADGLTRGFLAGLHWRGRLEGPGRPLLLLHDAGGSGRLFAPALAAIAARRPVAALDLPGHGLSDELPAPEDWTVAASDWIAAAGWERPAVAGFHVGGVIAAALKAGGVAGAAGLIGAPVFTPEEAAERLERYTPSLAPTWEGAHLARAWRMLRRQSMFYPWHAPTRAARLARLGPLDPATLHRRCVDLLRAAPIYEAAYAHQHGADVGGLARRAETLALFRIGWDPLASPERAAALAAHARVEEIALADAPAEWSGPLSGWAM